MDAAAPRAEPKQGAPLIPPNYVSLRHLQELRLKEKEEQRLREEEEAAARRVREEQQQQQREKEAAARKVKEEGRKREKAASRRVKESAAAPASKPEMKASSNTSFRHKERSRGGQQFVVVAQRPPPLHGDGTVKKKDVGAGAGEGYRGEMGPDGQAANASHGGGHKAENKGKEKVSADRKGEPGEPATAPPHPGKPEEKRKVEPLLDQGTASGTSDAADEPAEAAISSSRRSVRAEYRPKGKNGSGRWRTRTATTSEQTDASPTQGVTSANKGKKKPLEGRCTDVAPISDLPDGKSLQPATATDGSMNRRRRGDQGFNPEAKSKVAEKKQPVVEVKAPGPSAEGISNSRRGRGQVMNPEAKSEGPEKKQTVVEVKTQPCPSAEGSSNWISGSGQGTTQEAKSEGLGEKQAVVMMGPKARRMPRAARSSAWQRSGGGRGNDAVWQHDMIWVPKPVVVPPNAEVE